MATTKRRPTSKKSTTSSRKQDKGLPARAARTVKQQPYVSAAIATGAVTAVAAAVAGAFFFSRNRQAIGEFADDVSGKIKGGLDEARGAAAEGIRSFKEKAAFFFDEDDGSTNQNEIMEEALSIKETGRKPKHPVDPTIDKQIKAGSVSY